MKRILAVAVLILVLITASESKKHREGVKGIVEVDGGNGIHKKFLVLKGNRSEEEENDFDIQHIDHGKIVVKKGDKDVLLIRPSEGHKEHKKIEETEFGHLKSKPKKKKRLSNEDFELPDSNSSLDSSA